jgi:hypothetical protein
VGSGEWERGGDILPRYKLDSFFTEEEEEEEEGTGADAELEREEEDCFKAPSPVALLTFVRVDED